MKYRSFCVGKTARIRKTDSRQRNETGRKEFLKGRRPTLESKRENIVKSTAGVLDADITPLGLSKATFTMLAGRIDGENYMTEVANTGLLPLLRANVTQSLRIEDQPMFNNRAFDLGRLRGKKTFGLNWSVSGLGVIWALLEQFFLGFITADVRGTVNALGFSKDIQVSSRIPVDNVEWKLF